MKRFKNYLLLAVLMSMVGGKVFAHDIEVDNIYYNWIYPGMELAVTYDTSDNHIKYAGSITIPASVKYGSKTYSVTAISEGAFDSCYELTSVVVPEGVTSIGDCAFAWCENLKTVKLPSTLGRIGGQAFCGCKRLSSLTLPDNVYSIGDWTFGSCTSLTSIKIPSSLDVIGNYLFDGCSGLTSVTLSYSLGAIGERAFQNCSNLKSISIPGSIVGFGYGVFSGCTKLKTVTFDEGAGSISDGMFYGCSSLSSINLPYSAITIGNHAFAGCISIKNIKLPNTLTSIGKQAFQDCINLTTISIPGKVSSIGEYAFNNCQNLKTVSLGNGITTIPNYMFQGCSALTSVLIPSSIISLGTYSFKDCKGLTSITIPSSVSSIGDYAFDGSNNLTCVIMKATTPPSLNNYLSSNQANATLYVPTGCKAAYEAANYWKSFKTISEITNLSFTDTNVKTLCVQNWDADGDGELNVIEAAAVDSLGTIFSGNNDIVSFDEFQYFINLNKIGANAFSGCSNLSTIIIPKGVMTIGDQAFDDCSSLASITVEAGNAKYDSRDNCNAVIETATNKLVVGSNTAVIPNTVTSIGNSAFSGCKKKSITLPSSITSIGSSAFYDAKKLESVIVEFTTPIALPSNAFLVETGVDVVRSHITVYVPKGCGSAFKNSSYWKGFKAIVAEKDNQTMELTELPVVIYGDEDYTLPATTTEGLALTWAVTDEAVAIVSDGKLVFKKAGSTKVTATQTGNDDYESFSREFTLTIGKAALTITANDKTKTMGEENPELTVSYDGFANGDDATVLTQQPVVTTTATSESRVGTYPITVSGAEASNYEITYVNGTLTVGKAALTITANDQTKVEGEENPELTVSYAGFVSGDDETVLTTLPSVTTTATKDSPVGTYPITVAGATSDDYEISYVAGTLTVTENKTPTDISQLDNAIYVEPFTARVGAETVMEICLKNAEAATAYVFDLVLPEGVTVAKNEKGKFIDALSDRHDDHTRTFNDKGNNTYSLSTLSGNSEELTGNDGAIRLVTVSVADDMAEGTYVIQINNASYSKPDGTLVTLPNTVNTITVEDYLPGDVNGNGGVDIGDAVTIVNYLVGKESTNFVEKAADTNKNGQIDIGDAVTIVNFLVGKTESLSRMAKADEREAE